MKKRIKISLRTKIYVTILGLLTLTGIVYAANPVTFSVFPGLTGVAVSKSELFTTGFADPNSGIYTLNCAGIPTLYQASAPAEKYFAIAPAQAGPPNNTFTPRDIFVTFGSFIFKATPPGPFTAPAFATVSCSDADHTGITFDKSPTGIFGNDLIATCKDGGVFRVNGAGAVTQIASAVGEEIEGPVVAPASFGTFGGQILVADEAAGVISAIGPPPTYTVTHNIFNYQNDEPTPEALAFVPDQPLCTFCGFAFFQTSQQGAAGQPSMFAYPPSDFTNLSGSLIVTLESDQRILLVQNLAGNYSTTIFDNPPGFNILEGAAFVDCDIPTPTPTATATFTPTPTATFTPTATATFTPTATATFTPTATATFTPTPTPTSTPTPPPSATPFGTPNSKITPTGTTCNEFKNGTAETLASLSYSVSNGKIGQNVTPGVFFYWVKVTVPTAGNNVFTVTESITTGNFSTPFLLGGGSNVFDLNCNSVSETITQNTTTGTVTVTFNAPTAGTYIISLKYNSKSIAGAPAPSPGTTVHYDFATTGVPASTSGLDLIKN